MTKEEARRRLDALNSTIHTAVLLIAAERETLEQFFAEARDMDNVGHILDPTLFNSSERRATQAILTPIYTAALDLVRAYEGQVEAAAAAVAKVKRHG